MLLPGPATVAALIEKVPARELITTNLLRGQPAICYVRSTSNSSRLAREHVLALSDLGLLSFSVNEVDLHGFFQMKRTPAG